MKALTQIRSKAIAKANSLQKLHRHLADLQPAFRAYLAGEVFVGGRGNFRSRITREVFPWSPLVKSLFFTLEDFAFAAAMLSDSKIIITAPEPAPEKPAGRVNVIALATAAAA
jgi:hypothetical protein